MPGTTSITEAWKQIPELIQRGIVGYEVSSIGRLRSYWNSQSQLLLESHLMKLSYYKTGYPYVCIRQHNYKIHRFVLNAFSGPCPPGLICRHLDGDPTNNRVDNLCWGTHKENSADRTRHGRNNSRENLPIEQHGTNNPRARFTEEQILEIRDLYRSGISQQKIADQRNVAQTTISAIIRGQTWKCMELSSLSARPKRERRQTPGDC